MISVNKLCEQFQKALALKCPYVSPGKTTMATIKDGVDCSGLFVAAFKALGGSIYHGSNTIYRDCLTTKGKLTKASQLFVGAAVFKWSADGQPAKFEKDGIGNMHHIGLCVSVNPLKIIHASSATGYVTCDTKLGKWTYFGKLKNVDYGTTAPSAPANTNAQEATTMATAGGTLKTKVDLNIRAGKSTGAKRLGGIPAGKTVAYNGTLSSGWVQITYNKIAGYICSKAQYVTGISTRDATQDDAPVTVAPEIDMDSLTLESLAEMIMDLQARIQKLEAK